MAYDLLDVPYRARPKFKISSPQLDPGSAQLLSVCLGAHAILTGRQKIAQPRVSSRLGRPITPINAGADAQRFPLKQAARSGAVLLHLSH